MATGPAHPLLGGWGRERLKAQHAIGGVASGVTPLPAGGGSDSTSISGSGSSGSRVEMEEDASGGRRSSGMEARVGAVA